jgi:UDP-N-acetylglucosamine 2-epimerase
MRYSLCVIGNSSSGIIEAPLLGAKSVNIGARQSGRVMAKTIFSSSFSSLDIFNSINRALSNKSRQNLQKLSTKDSPSSKIINVIQEIPLPLKNYKKFHDIK